MIRNATAVAIAGVLGLVTSVSGAASVEADAAPGAPALAGTTVVSGSSTAVQRVVLPGSAARPSVRIRTQGWIGGIALIEAGESYALDERPAYYAFRFARCSDLPCDDYATIETGSSRLPSGGYDLYVVAAGGDTAATMSFKGMGGRTAVAPTEVVRSKVRALPLDDQVSSGGRRRRKELQGRGFGVYTFALDAAAPHAGTAFAHCIYRRRADVPEVPYQPTSCPPAGGQGDVVTSGGDALELTSSGITPYLPEAIGAWHSSAGPVEDVSALALWVALRT